MKNKLGLLVLWGLFSVFIPGQLGCGEREIFQPEDVLHRVKLDFPSLLGYVRIQADLCGTQGRDTEVRNDPRIKLLDFLIPCPDLVMAQCMEGSQLILVLLDPVVFGGPTALHFEHREKGALEKALLADGRYTAVPGSHPPEFIRNQQIGLREQVLSLIKALGIETPHLLLNGFSRLIVQETDQGTMVLPSHDIVPGFQHFLQETGYLKAWGDTGLVVNLEVLRLAMAYQEEMNRMSRSLKEVESRMGWALNEEARLQESISSLTRFIPEVIESLVKSLEGVRYVSSTPWNGCGELALEKANNGCFHDLLAALENGPPDLAGLIHQGGGMQWNFNPQKLGGLVKEGLAFYEDAGRVDREARREQRQRLLLSLAGDTGRYLSGLVIDGGEGALVFASSKDQETTGGELEETTWEALVRYLIGPESIQAGQGKNGIRVSTCSIEQDYLGFIQPLIMETGSCEGKQLTTVRYAQREGGEDLMGKLLRLAKMGGGHLRAQGLPQQAVLYLYLPLLPQLDLLMPGIETVVPTGIMGYGMIEGDKLVISFLR